MQSEYISVRFKRYLEQAFIFTFFQLGIDEIIPLLRAQRATNTSGSFDAVRRHHRQAVVWARLRSQRDLVARLTDASVHLRLRRSLQGDEKFAIARTERAARHLQRQERQSRHRFVLAKQHRGTEAQVLHGREIAWLFRRSRLRPLRLSHSRLPAEHRRSQDEECHDGRAGGEGGDAERQPQRLVRQQESRRAPLQAPLRGVARRGPRPRQTPPRV